MYKNSLETFVLVSLNLSCKHSLFIEESIEKLWDKRGNSYLCKKNEGELEKDALHQENRT